MDEIRVSSWNELGDQLYEGAWQEPLRRFRSRFAFRGMGRSDHDLRSSLIRLGLGYEKQEGHMLRNFRKYAEREGKLADSLWNWLALAQHHGFPTRLLDWTYSPFVALHFATENLDCFDTDGIIHGIDFSGANALLPDGLKAILEQEGSDVFTVEMLQQAASTLGEFDALAPEPFVVFFEPPSIDDRIVNQFSLFALMSSPTATLDEWACNHADLCRKIIVPHELKWEVRDKLDQANITERVLFPGLDGLSRWLKRYYTPVRVAEAESQAKDSGEQTLKDAALHEPQDDDRDR